MGMNTKAPNAKWKLFLAAASVVAIVIVAGLALTSDPEATATVDSTTDEATVADTIEEPAEDFDDAQPAAPSTTTSPETTVPLEPLPRTVAYSGHTRHVQDLSLIHISEPTRPY